jgi:hypothetical protein
MHGAACVWTRVNHSAFQEIYHAAQAIDGLHLGVLHEPTAKRQVPF